ncbi:serine/threonine-protein kinase [Nocardia callitridis]|uniref:Serine/threonine-protein kinase n=2 Tax=Nocardia callitridis TaxID=648753 RepID=A0ABP9KQH8_9NOCA
MRPIGVDDPTRIGDYRILGLLGSGGMGRVYLGRSAGGRTVAVKVVRPDLLGDNEFRARFRREVAAAARVDGKFTAPVLDANVDADPPWLATGYVPGPSLTEAVERYGPLSRDSLVVLARGLAEALVAVHAAGVIHRDLKPSNVLLTLDGPRVIDFGIARAVDDSVLTTTGKVVGSPAFMCPEQASNEPVGPEGDVFALGGVLVFAATGHGPFGGDEMMRVLWRVVYEPPRLDGLPDSLRPLAAACLAKDPAARPTPSDIVAELARLGPSERGGWLPGAAVAEIGRRMALLLDLETPPEAGMPTGSTTRATSTDPSRSNAAVPARDPSHSTTTQDRGEPPPADLSHAITSHDRRDPHSPNHSPSISTQDHRDPHSPNQALSTTTQDRRDPPDPSRATTTHVRLGPPAGPPTYSASAHTDRASMIPGRPTPPGNSIGTRARVALGAGAVLVAVAVATAAFVVGTQLRDNNAATTPDQSPLTTVDAPSSTVRRSAGPASTEVPAAFVGDWQGTAQDGMVAFDIELSIHGGAVGDEVATSANIGTTFGTRCERTERLDTATATELGFTARLSGGASDCTDDGKASTITLRQDGTLSYRTPGALGGTISGTLRQN